jgi:hypothetical protein
VRNSIINSINIAAASGGRVDYSVFNGSQYLYVDDGGDLSPSNRLGDYWMLVGNFYVPADTTMGSAIYEIAGKQNSSGGTSFGIRLSNSPSLSSNATYGSNLNYGFDTGFNYGEWHNIMFFLDFNLNQYSFYTDNQLPLFGGQGSINDSDDSVGNFMIGGNIGGENMLGQLNYIRIFHSDERSSYSDINAGNAIGTEVAWWNLEEGLTDKSGNGYDLTPVGF